MPGYEQRNPCTVPNGLTLRRRKLARACASDHVEVQDAIEHHAQAHLGKPCADWDRGAHKGSKTILFTIPQSPAGPEHVPNLNCGTKPHRPTLQPVLQSVLRDFQDVPLPAEGTKLHYEMERPASQLRASVNDLWFGRVLCCVCARVIRTTLGVKRHNVHLKRGTVIPLGQ